MTNNLLNSDMDSNFEIEPETRTTINMSKSSNFKENIFFKSIIKQRVIVQAKYLNSHINQYLLDYLKNRFEGKCISEGYIQPDSIEIMEKSIGYINGSRFMGDVNYDILFKANICNPIINNMIECEVKFINKLGLLCKNGPITIIVGRQFHFNPNLLDNIQVGEIIKISVIDKKFSLNDRHIEVTAKLIEEEISNVNSYLTSNNMVEGDLEDELDNLFTEDENDTINSKILMENNKKINNKKRTMSIEEDDDDDFDSLVEDEEDDLEEGYQYDDENDDQLDDNLEKMEDELENELEEDEKTLNDEEDDDEYE
jgi:DNA-directed RNA polymerase subunit E'/Rpb7